MSVLFRNQIWFLLALLVVLAGSSYAQVEGVGFQARLQTSSQVVSAYHDPDDRFSAAWYPLSYSVLNRNLLLTPKPDAKGDFDNNAFAFSTRIRRDVELVPISVDANQFYQYRVRYRINETWAGFATNTLVRVKQTGRRDGLSIGMRLPKRFDQMFGDGGANLRVSGYRRITFSGRSQWDDNAGSSVRQQSKFPALNMEQISRFSIQGTIGTKISVSVSQDNQTDIPLANRLIIRYKGDEDDILKTIEAGNTTLSIPNTRFVGYAQRIQGLFGIKAEAQLGSLKFTAIASQEKGSSESASVSATGEENADFLRDYGYSEGRIFDLAHPGEIGIHDSVKVIRVWEEETRIDNPDANEVYLRASANPADETYDLKTLLMRETTGVGYELLYGQNPDHCPIAIVFYASKRRALGIYMEITRYSASGDSLRVDTIGHTGGELDTLRILQTITKDMQPGNPAWDLMWRNCYRIPRGVRISDINIRVLKGLPGREGTTSSLDNQTANGVAQDLYIKILGIDQWNNSRTTSKIPDGLVDGQTETYREDWGLLIFPDREPFNSGRSYEDASGNISDTLIEKIPTLYTYDSRTGKVENSKYYLEISTKAHSATIRLGRANIIESSERVTLNGRTLTKGTDYNISYDMGQVTLLTDEATDPNADVQVEFQYAPFMALQKKSLLGFRTEYEYSPDLKIGATYLYKSDKAQERKPRVGQETTKATVIDFDVSFALHPNFLTKMIDALPLISTEADSRLRVTAEIAQSRPNPNVDGNAYVDDFESAVELLSLGNIRTNWTLASEPLQVDSLAKIEGVPRSRGTIRWHNPPQISRKDVYAGETAAGQGALTPLRLFFRPHGFQYSGPADDICADSIETKSWGGIMRSFANRIDERRVLTFEVRAKGGSGILHFDFGRISEDINGNGVFEDEDQSSPKNYTLDVDLDEGINEDLGLDIVGDGDEIDFCGVGYNSTSNPDPASDNWWYEGHGIGRGDNSIYPPVPKSFWDNNPVYLNYQELVNDPLHWLHYEWQNGTEGNIDDDAVQGQPDGEQLSRVSSEDDNAYFSFALPLSSDLSNEFIVPGSGRNGWFTYQVPVRDPGVLDTLSDGQTANWATVTHVRVWFENDDVGADADSLLAMDSIWIADWGFIQSSWHDTLLTDVTDDGSDFYIASVSEDDGTFTPPPGVDAYIDPLTNISETQRGLALKFDGLTTGSEGIARKDLLRTESYSGYRRMEMFVHGDTGIERSDSLMFYFRIGLDSLNFYEYRTFIDSGWAEGNNVNIVFDEITALKDAADRALSNRRDHLEDSSSVYRVIGHPNINEIRFISASVENLGSQPVSGEVWIDELRVSDVRKDIGTAARIVVSGSLADLITYNFSYEHRDAFFRGLSQATRGGSKNNLGSGQESNTLSFGGTFNLSKILPRSWSARLPITFGYAESETIPLLRTNSDVVLPEAVREAEKSTSRSTKVSFSESFSKKGSSLLFNALLNRQKINFSYNRSRKKRVTNPYIFAENYNVRAEFNMGIVKPPAVSVFSWTRSIPLLKKAKASSLSLFPTKWRWSATFNRNLQVKDDVDYNRTSSFSRTFDGRMETAYRPFSTMSFDFSMATKRDLTDASLVNLSFRNPKLGLENNYNQALRTSYDPKLFSFLTSAFAYSVSYTDNYDRSSGTRTTSLSRNWSVGGDFRHKTLLGSKKKKSTRGKNTRGTVRGGVRDKDAADKESGPPIYEPILDGLRFLTGWLQSVRYKYAQGFNRSIPGVAEKLPWKYRLGFDNLGEFPVASSTRNPSSGESINYEFSSGFSVLGGITTTIGFKEGVSRNLATVGTDRTETINTSWPELTLQIRKFTHLPFIKKQVNWFIGVFSPRTGYSRQAKEVRNVDRDGTINRSETINRNPIISLNLKIFRRLSLSGAYNVARTVDEKFNRSTFQIDTETRSTKKTIALSTKYAFSAPSGLSIPLLGKLKFKSMVSIDFNVQYASNMVETSKKGGDFVPFTNTSSFSASPVLSYSFSTKIRGGVTMRWQDTNDAQRHRVSHVREVQIWTEIQF